MNTDTISVDIICPKCKRKAKYSANAVGAYKIYPDLEGIVTCTNCGHNSKHTFTNNDYYYKVEVNNRTLFARNIENLKSLRDYFENGYKLPSTDPELDFPKEFYLNKELIVHVITRILNTEMGNG